MKYIVDVNEQGQITATQPYTQQAAESATMRGDISLSNIITLVIVAVLLVVIAKLSVVIVKQQTIKMIQRFGKFKQVAKAGLSFKVPFIDWVAGRVDLRIQDYKFQSEVKTKDNVFINVGLSVQYFVSPEKSMEAFYKLENPETQIGAFVLDILRAKIPTMNLDDTFEQKDEVATEIQNKLADFMDDFGYTILKALIIDIEPNAKVKEAMNEINASQRLRVAAQEKGEAEKIIQIKKAEGESESKRLQGEGIANQRKAIIEGLKKSVAELKDTGIDPREATGLIMLTQYFDTLKDIGANKVILLPHSPAGMKDIENQIRNAIISSEEAGKIK